MQAPAQAAPDKAVFLDRDGTIIEDRGHLADPADVRVYPGVPAALRSLQVRYRLFIVTHQVGIARGILTAEDVARVNRHLVEILADQGVAITEVYCCPHERDAGCICIKPKPHVLRRAADAYGLDLTQCYSVGDHPPDVDLGRNAGGQGLYVLTGHGTRHVRELRPGTLVFADLVAAARWILSRHADADAAASARG